MIAHRSEQAIRWLAAASTSSLLEVTAPEATSRMKSATFTPYGHVKPRVKNQ